MQEAFYREVIIKDKNELEREKELIKNIVETRETLKNNNKNFEFAESELIDYYIYQIKANQSKLDYLIKLAKKKGIILSRDKEVKIRMILQKKLVG